MHCAACNAANPDTNRFCENCGTSLSFRCPSCGFDCTPTARFCGGCGAPVHRGAVAVSAQPPRGSVAPTPPPAGLGELKQATVLFADIVSSTERIANLDPEEAMEQLQPAVARMCDVITGYGGTVLRTLGDGVMALFGLPRALEDHAMRACEAALSMQEAFRLEDTDLAIRVGLHSGMVASDPESHDAMRGGGAHGLAIHIASRVVSLAEPGGICLTQDCLGLLRAGAQAHSLGPRVLKGLRDPVEVHVLQSLHPLLARDQQPLGGTGFCGRTEELAMLQEALRRTRAGDTQAVGIRAAPGTGKSRLCQEFVERCRALGLRVHQVRVQPYGHATPLQAILDILRSFLFEQARDGDSAEVRERVAAQLASWPEALPGDVALLCEFLGIAAPQEDSRADLAERRARLFDVISGLLRHAPDEEALLLLEDLHWLDESSEAFVSGILSALQGRRTLVLLNYRPRAPAAWESLPFFRCIDLRELSRLQTEEMVRSLLSHRPEFADVCEIIARRSGGNPFFAEELVRSIAQGGAFVRDGAANGPQFEFADEALPQTVQAVIAARIDRLNAHQKKLLQICAIVGKEVPQQILEDVARGEIDNLGATLRELCRLEFLTMPGKPPHLFAFGHPLIQEVAYATQLKARRSMIHALVAQAMAQRFGDRPEQAGLIGHHFEAANRPVEAARHVARAARWLSTSEIRASALQWQRVLTLLQQQPRSEDVDRLRLMANVKVAQLGWRGGSSIAELKPFIEAAKSLATEIDSRMAQLLLVTEGRQLLAAGGSADEYVQRVHQALALTQEADTGRRAVLHAALCHAYGRAGFMREALLANDTAWRDRHAIETADHDFADIGLEGWLLALRGRSLARCGRRAEAETAWLQMLAEGVEPVVEVIAYLGRVELAWCDGDAAAAQAQSRRVEELAAKRQVPYLRVLGQFCSGVAAGLAGELETASSMLTTALTLLRSARVAMEFEPEILAALAECAMRSDELEAARDYATMAIRISRSRAARIAECRALIVLGMVHAMAGGEGDEAFDAAETLVRQTGALSYEAPLARARAEFGGRRLRQRVGA